MGRHKKHKKHQSSLTPGVLQDDGVLSELEAGGSGAEQMKVILKLSSSRQKVPKHTKVHPEPVSPPAELVVSISRLYLRPATPTCVGTWEEENMDEIPHLLSSTSSSAEHKSHKSKKHKKHKKHSSHELQSSSVLHASPLHSPIQIRLLGGSGMSHSGKEMTSLVSQHASHTSPFKFTFSREVMTGKLDEGRQPLTMSSPPTVSHHHDKKSHKHKKHHRHHHHHHAAHTSPLESTDLSVVEVSCYNPSLAVRQSVSGKQFNSPPWLGDDDDSERPSAQVSCDSIQDSPSVQDVSGEMSHDNDSQSHDQESEVCVGMPWLTTEPTLSKPHKKKKKKHKHLQHDLSIPIPPLTITPSTSTLQNPSPASPVSHGTPIQPPPQQAYISSGVKRRRESSREEDALMATSHLSKKPHYTSPLLILSPTPPPSVATTPKKDVPSITKPMPPEEANPLPPPSLPPPPYPPSQRPSISPPAVKLSSNALKFFLKNILYLIQKRDPEGIFVEPVTDDIAPGYSAIITNPMDLTTMATKVEANLYPSVKEFKSDFTLMCNNAMTYNTAETVYYVTAKRLLSSGLQIIAKETSLRPDIRLGRVLADNSGFFSSPFPLPSVAPEFNLPHPSNISINYDSAFLCSLPLHKIKPHPPPTQGDISELLRADGFGNLDLEKFGIRE